MSIFGNNPQKSLIETIIKTIIRLETTTKGGKVNLIGSIIILAAIFVFSVPVTAQVVLSMFIVLVNCIISIASERDILSNIELIDPKIILVMFLALFIQVILCIILVYKWNKRTK